MAQRLHFSPTVLAVVLLVTSAATVAAQTGRVRGIVRDEEEQPIRGATIIAENPDNFGPSSITATTDDKGRFSMIGLRLGQWRLVAHAPGYGLQAGNVTVRPISAAAPPLTLTLKKSGPATMGVLANISAKDVMQQLTAADALFAQQKWDEAIAGYRAILAKAPSLTAVHLQIAAAYRAQNNYDAAITEYESELSDGPADEAPYLGIAQTHTERGDRRMAEDALLKAVGAEVAGRDVFFALGEMSLARGESANASEWFNRAAGADPSWAKPRYRLGELALADGDKGQAVRLLDEAIAVDPQSPEAALARATLEQLNR